MSADVIVCAPPTFPLRRIAHCPTCKRRRRFAGLDAPWYGVTWACCGCGDSWTDGEMHPRPFKPRWRAQAIARARQVWQDAGTHTKADRRAWLDEQIGGGS